MVSLATLAMKYSRFQEPSKQRNCIFQYSKFVSFKKLTVLGQFVSFLYKKYAHKSAIKAGCRSASSECAESLLFTREDFAL